jgi:cytoskeletal protein CcmA (bactofilin family)
MAWGNKSGETPSNAGGALSFLGSEVRITGNLDATGNMHLDGTVEGDVTCGNLTLGASGTVLGNIVAEYATIAGTVDGTVSAATLVIEKSASITGDMSYDAVTIENGAKVEGRLTKRTAGAGELKLVSVVNE